MSMNFDQASRLLIPRRQIKHPTKRLLRRLLQERHRDLTIQSDADIWFRDDCECPPPAPRIPNPLSPFQPTRTTTLLPPQLTPGSTTRTTPSPNFPSPSTVSTPYWSRPSLRLHPRPTQRRRLLLPSETTLYKICTSSSTCPSCNYPVDAKLTYPSTRPRLMYAFDVIDNVT